LEEWSFDHSGRGFVSWWHWAGGLGAIGLDTLDVQRIPAVLKVDDTELPEHDCLQKGNAFLSSKAFAIRPKGIFAFWRQQYPCRILPPFPATTLKRLAAIARGSTASESTSGSAFVLNGQKAPTAPKA
jgi:hypothetical protein